MIVERASRRGERPLVAAILLSATFLSMLLGFRLGMYDRGAVGFGIQVPAPGLDNSYTYAMNRASAEGRVFGRDFISTYGPYGYLIAAMDVAGLMSPWILSQLVLTGGLGLAAGAYVLSARGPRWSSLGFVLLVLVPIHALADEYRWLSLVVILVSLSVRAEGRRALAASGAAGLVAGFGLLIKLSLGLGGILSVVAGALLAWRARAVAGRLFAAGVAAATGLLGGLVLHQGSLDGLGDYLTTAAAVTGGYSSAMSLVADGGSKVTAAFVVFLLFLGAAAALGPRRTRLALAACGAPLFLAWKHALVRQDVHVQIFVLFGFVVVAITLVDASVAWSVPRVGPVLLLGVAALVFAWWASPSTGRHPAETLVWTLRQPLRLPGIAGLSTLANLTMYRETRARESAEALQALRLPEDALVLVGGQTVDVYPWEAPYVVANGFNWTSRPSPASFATYGPALDARNAVFFEAASRPRFVLWHEVGATRSVDRRHLFWDEPLTMFALLDRYEVAWHDRVTLLRARRERRFAPPERVMTVRVSWDEWLTLPVVKDGLLAQVEIDTPFLARARRALLREDPAYVLVRFANGTRTRYRYVPDQGPSGLWIHPLPRDADDVVALFGGGCTRTRATALRFQGFRPGARGPRVTLWRVRGAPGPAFDCGE